MMPIVASTRSSGARSTDACGNSASEKRRNPYVPILRSTPASTTEPAVGASVWASGSQVCNGNSGTFTAKAAKNAMNSHLAVPESRPPGAHAVSVRRSKVRFPVALRCRNASVRKPTSRNAEPAMVKRKNLSAAYCRRSWPHPRMMKYIGTRTNSKKTKNTMRSSAEEHAHQRRLEHEHPRRERLRSLLQVGRREQTDREEQRVQDDHEQADAVDADDVLDAERPDPTLALDELVAGVPGLEVPEEPPREAERGGGGGVADGPHDLGAATGYEQDDERTERRCRDDRAQDREVGHGYRPAQTSR